MAKRKIKAGVLGGILKDSVAPTVKSTGGALAVDALWTAMGGYLPTSLQVDGTRQGVKAVAAIAVGELVKSRMKTVKTKGHVNDFVAGALTVQLHQLVHAHLPKVSPELAKRINQNDALADMGNFNIAGLDGQYQVVGGNMPQLENYDDLDGDYLDFDGEELDGLDDLDELDDLDDDYEIVIEDSAA